MNFDWWYEEEEEDTFFIVAASSKTKEGSEVFNSYGRRNNRFLLTWYGFTNDNTLVTNMVTIILTTGST